MQQPFSAAAAVLSCCPDSPHITVFALAAPAPLIKKKPKEPTEDDEPKAKRPSKKSEQKKKDWAGMTSLFRLHLLSEQRGHSRPGKLV